MKTALFFGLEQLWCEMIVVVRGAGGSPDMFSFAFQRTIGPGASHIACKGQTRVRMMFTVFKPGVSLLVALLGGWAVDEEEHHIAL